MARTEYTGGTLAFSLVGNVLLVVHGAAAAAPDEWSLFVDSQTDLYQDGVLVVTDPAFPGLDSRQRKMAAEGWEKRGKLDPVALITTNGIHRGVLTAVNWFTRGSMKAFAPAEVLAALNFIGVRAEVRQELLLKSTELLRALGSSFALPDISNKAESA